MPTNTICYTGVGAKASGMHSDSEFVKRVKAAKVCRNSKTCPAPDNVQGWVDWSGAIKTTPKQCKTIVLSNEHNTRIREASARLRTCVSKGVRDGADIVAKHDRAKEKVIEDARRIQDLFVRQNKIGGVEFAKRSVETMNGFVDSPDRRAFIEAAAGTCQKELMDQQRAMGANYVFKCRHGPRNVETITKEGQLQRKQRCEKLAKLAAAAAKRKTMTSDEYFRFQISMYDVMVGDILKKAAVVA